MALALRSRRMPRPARGYTLLAVLLIVLALSLIVFASLQYALSERRNSAIVHDDALALAIAQAGLERTMVYLDTLNATDADLDRALDPQLDTACAFEPPGRIVPAGGQDDDNLPAFTDPGSASVTVPPANRRYRLVPNQGGAYLIRIEDNDDDGQQGFPFSTSNNASTGCVEGPPIRQNPVRDRDRTVMVHVIGIYPGTDLNVAKARRSLHVMVGPSKGAGIIAGGTADFQTSSHVCGAFGDTAIQGDLMGACLCGTGCVGGPAYQNCPGNACAARVSGECRMVKFGGGGGDCLPESELPKPLPVAFPWDRTNAPQSCMLGPCTPFYYLRYDRTTNRAQVFLWNYAKSIPGGIGTCHSPRAWTRLCHPSDEELTDCAQCWTLMNVSSGLDVTMTDTPALDSPTPPNAAILIGPPVWHVSNKADPITGAGGCATDSAYPYPGPVNTLWSSENKPGVTFDLVVNPGAVLPHGIWFVEGNVHTVNATPNCAGLASRPSWSASIISMGDFIQDSTMLALRPAAPKGFVILAGRDFQMRAGPSQLWSCTPGAVMAHEQFEMNAGNHLTAQVVVESGARCSDLLGGNAITMHGDATIEVPFLPVIGLGPLTTPLTWSESSY